MAKAHTDRVIDIDDCLAIDAWQARYIHLIKGDFAATIWENTYLTVDGSFEI